MLFHFLLILVSVWCLGIKRSTKLQISTEILMVEGWGDCLVKHCMFQNRNPLQVFLYHRFSEGNVSGYSRNPCSLIRERDAAWVFTVWERPWACRLSEAHIGLRQLIGWWRESHPCHVVTLYWRTCHLLLRFLCWKDSCRQHEELGSKCSVSFPIQRTRVMRVTRDVLYQRFTKRCVSFHALGTIYQTRQAKNAALSGPLTNQTAYTAGSNRQNLRTRSRIKIQVVEPDESVQRGLSCCYTNFL